MGGGNPGADPVCRPALGIDREADERAPIFGDRSVRPGCETLRTMKRGPYRVHPARVSLGLHGYTVTALAERAGMSAGGITRQISGECRLTPKVYNALVELIGEAGAADVIAAIPSRERAAA